MHPKRLKFSEPTAPKIGYELRSKSHHVASFASASEVQVDCFFFQGHRSFLQGLLGVNPFFWQGFNFFQGLFPGSQD